MKKAKYICIEGTEGVGKGLQTDNLVKYFESKGLKVLLTKEPGTPHLPITQKLRGIMLNSKYEKRENFSELIAELTDISESLELTQTAKEFVKEAMNSILENSVRKTIEREENYNPMTIPARELISQAIRSVHLENLIAKEITNYDIIIQDRGLLSGIAYGEACGNKLETLIKLASKVTKEAQIRERNIFQKVLIKMGAIKEFGDLYDNVIYLNGNAKKGLETAKNAKQEFADGDAMEARGNSFMEKTEKNFKKFMTMFHSVKIVNVHITERQEVISDSDVKDVEVIKFRDKDVIFNEILQAIGEK